MHIVLLWFFFFFFACQVMWSESITADVTPRELILIFTVSVSDFRQHKVWERPAPAWNFPITKQKKTVIQKQEEYSE